MPSYVVLTREKTLDSNELERYNQMAPGSFVGHAATFLVRHGRHKVLEGPNVDDVMIAEFPTSEAAMAWYESAAYRDACQHRLLGGDFRCILVEGL